MQPLVVEVALDQLDHRPLEQQPERLGVAAEARARSPRGWATAPIQTSSRPVGPERLAQRGASPPASPASRRGRPGRSRRDLRLAALVVVPELDAAPVLERHEQPAVGRRPAEAVAREVELVASPADAAGPPRRRRATSARRATAPPACRRRRPAPAPRAPARACPPARGRRRRPARCAPPRRRSRPSAARRARAPARGEPIRPSTAAVGLSLERSGHGRAGGAIVSRRPGRNGRPPATDSLRPPLTDRLYYTDAYLRTFDATVVDRADDGRRIYLDRTAFYPTSGGPAVRHRHARRRPRWSTSWTRTTASPTSLESPVAATGSRGAIDWPRRFDHMQQHTGQHLLSAVIAELLRPRHDRRALRRARAPRSTSTRPAL